MNINEITAEAIDQLNYGDNEFLRARRMAVRGIRLMKWDFIGKQSTTEVNVLPNRTALIPDGCIKVLDVGVVESDGRFRSFAPDSRLSNVNATCDDRFDEVQPEDHMVQDGDEDRYAYEYSGVRPIQGRSNIEGYSVDLESGVILFDSNFSIATIAIKQLSVNNENTSVEVPEMVSECLIAFIVWKLSLSDKSISTYDRRENERLYKVELRNAKTRMSSVPNSLKNKISRRAVRQTIKG